MCDNSINTECVKVVMTNYLNVHIDLDISEVFRSSIELFCSILVAVCSTIILPEILMILWQH